MTEEKASPFVEPSPQARFYGAHRDLMELSKAQPPNSSYAIPKGFAGDTGLPISFALLRELCAHISVGNKVFCCIDHGSVFEVHRLGDGDSAKIFYKFHNIDSSTAENEDIAIDTIRNLLEGFKNLALEEIVKYEAAYKIEMKVENLVSYSYIQRRMSCVAAFRKHHSGATAKIKECLRTLVSTGEIIQLSKENSKSKFDTAMVLYQIVNIKKALN